MYEVEVTLPKRSYYTTAACVSAEFTSESGRRGKITATEGRLHVMGWDKVSARFSELGGPIPRVPIDLVRDVIAAYEKAEATPPIIE